jgi:AcrR family transcriptional regulator
MTAATDEKRGGQATGGRRLTPRGLRTRARLVAAARQVFEQIPFRQARLTDITAAAGVAAGTFYTYFDSKEEIFREVADEVLQELSHAARRDADNAEGDAIRDIAHASRQYFLACLRNAVGSSSPVAPPSRSGSSASNGGSAGSRSAASVTASSIRGRRRSRCTR